MVAIPYMQSCAYLLPVALLSWSLLAHPAYLLSLLGHTDVPPGSLIRWANASDLHNEHCIVSTQAEACEDVKIHHSSSTAFIACGDAHARSFYYPPSGLHDAAGRPSDTWKEKLFTYDIKSKRTTELKLEGLEGDFISHGIDIVDVDSPDGLAQVHILAVNHARTGDSISIFNHVLGSNTAQLVKDVKHSGIRTANGVAATGPLSVFHDHHQGDPLIIVEVRSTSQTITHSQVELEY
jgi:arylesterase/paraoxonase